MGTVEINTGDGVRVRYLDIGHNVAVAVAADNDGQIHVLVRPQQPGPDEPMLLTFDGVSGKLMSSLTARDLGISTLPNSDWPFSLASAGAHQIAVSASDRFEVGGRGVKRIVGTTTRNAFDSIDLVGRMPCRRYPISLSVHGGEVIAVDGENGHVLRLERAGDVSLLGVAHADIVDATVHGEQLYLITANDRIERQSLSNLGKLEWEQPCNCLPDGRVAASGQTVFVAQPAARRVVGLDPVSGRATGYRRTHAGTGPWPADIVSSGSENLLTASLLDQEIEQWDSAGSLPSRWPAGYVVGPWRLTTTGGDKQAMVVAAMLDGSIEHYDPRFGLLLARWSPVVAGRVPRVADVAVDALGHVYIADPVLRMVYEFEPVGGEVPTPVDPQPSATPSSRSCNVTGSKIAAPHRVVLGSTLQVTLTLAARCPAAESAVGSDIILLIDYSPSEVATFAQKRTLSRSLVQMLDMRRHRVGLVGYPMGFEDDGHVLVALTSDAQAVIDGIDSLDPRRSPSQSFTGQALRGAARHLSEMGRPGALPVLVLMSDGGSDGTVNPIDIANRMRAAGVQIFTIGLSPNVSHDVLRAIAGSPERYYFAPAPEDMQSVYLQILHWATTSLAGNLVIEDEMGPDIDVISDSAIPHAIESGSRLEWSQPVVPGTGITMTYSIRPRRTGLLPTNRQAVAHYIDVDGSKREYVFPIPFVDVMAPTETATSTATPSPTTTPTPQIAIRPMYLPLLLHEQCTAVERRVDLALVLDTSSSMLELTPDGNTKLAAASSAAVGMLSQLRWVNGDQAALVTFNGDAALNQPLTGDSSAITGAFGQIVTNHQTRIHRGIELAYRELTSSRHNMSNLAVMVVLTDGHADPDPVSLAVEWASIAKAAGIEVFTIGLGQDLDAEALASMASKPQYFFTTVDPTALSAVFRQIAGTIPCRAEAFWGKR
jgi:Mg-chelatase subunit ChlD